MLYFGFIQSLLNAFIFWFRKPGHLANHILAIWFLIFSLFFLGLLIPVGLTAYIGVGFVPFMMLTGPVFYFYVKSLINIHFQFQWRHLVHVIPFALLSIFRMIYLPGSLPLIQTSTMDDNLFLVVVLTSLILSLLGYWTGTFVLLVRHHNNILNFFSNKSGKRSLNWVLFLMLITLISYVLFFAAPYLQNYFPSAASMTFWLHQFNMGMLGYLLLVFGLLQPIIFEPEMQSTEPKGKDNSPEKYSRSGLSSKKMEQYAKEITNYLEKEKPYKDPDYNIRTMIRDLDISQQNLSQTISEMLGKNFYQLINEYRVAEFEELLRDPKMQNFTFLGVAYEAGFNSKSSFNRIFKEIKGKTPSEFRKGHLNSSKIN